MLRASTADTNIDLQVIVQGADSADDTIPSGQALLRLAEASLGTDRDETKEAIAGLLEALGGEALIDAAATCAMFNAITKVADATGVKLDTALAQSSEDIREQLGINAFDTTVD